MLIGLVSVALWLSRHWIAATASGKISPMTNTQPFPAHDEASFSPVDRDRLLNPPLSSHPPRLLILYGSLRSRSFSRLAAEEAGHILTRLGAEVRFFNPSGLPLPDQPGADLTKVEELRSLVIWSEGMVWSSPERHGAMTGIMKAQIDWIPLSMGAIRPTQGKTLAVMQVSGGAQSFNAVNQMRILGRWMRLITIPNQSSIPKAFQEFDEAGRMRPSPLYDRIVDVMEELSVIAISGEFAFYLQDEFIDPLDIGVEVINPGETVYGNLLQPLDDLGRGQLGLPPTGPQRFGIQTGEPYAITDQWSGRFTGQVYADPQRSEYR